MYTYETTRMSSTRLALTLTQGMLVVDSTKDEIVHAHHT